MNAKKQSKSINQQLLVPVAIDGTCFGPHLARQGDRYSVGEKGKEYQVKGFANALDILARMPVAQWRRPNANNHWGIVSAVGKWKKLGDVVSEDDHSPEEVEKEQPMTGEVTLEETEIGQIYERIKGFYTQKTIGIETKGDALNELVGEILDAVNDASEIQRLCAASALGYLYAAPSVKNRPEVVFDPMKTLFDATPPSLSTLNIEGEIDNAKRRRYAADAIEHAEGDWLLDYCAKSAITEESNSDLPREKMISNVLSICGDLTGLFEALRDKISYVKQIVDIEQRFTRVKRVLESLETVVSDWPGDCGDFPGESLADLFVVSHRSVSEEAKKQDRYDAADSAQGVLARIIEIRFSFAMKADTFSVLRAIRKSMGKARYVDYLKHSNAILLSKRNILEAVLVLARQGKEDQTFADLVVDVYASRSSASAAIKSQFSWVSDLESEVRDWWEKTGKVATKRRAAVQREDSSFDFQVGELLIQIEDARESMEKLGKTVAPVLEINDPILADTVSRASNGYAGISQKIQTLGKSRRLFITTNKGDRNQEYSRKNHEMLGGHKPGVRKVRIVRNGVIKRFAGTKRMIIKEWVQPDE